MAWTRKSSVPPALGQGGEDGVERGLVGDVAGQHDVGADRRRQRLHPLAERLALVGEGERRALRRGRPARCPRRWTCRWRRP